MGLDDDAQRVVLSRVHDTPDVLDQPADLDGIRVRVRVRVLTLTLTLSRPTSTGFLKTTSSRPTKVAGRRAKRYALSHATWLGSGVRVRG